EVALEIERSHARIICIVEPELRAQRAFRQLRCHELLLVAGGALAFSAAPSLTRKAAPVSSDGTPRQARRGLSSGAAAASLLLVLKGREMAARPARGSRVPLAGLVGNSVAVVYKHR